LFVQLVKKTFVLNFIVNLFTTTTGIVVVVVFVLFFESASVSAWDWDAHRYIARQALASLLSEFPDCVNQSDEGSVYPDAVLKDFTNHHCYDSTCPSNDSNYCPQKIDCPALEKAREWVANASRETSCAKVFSLAVATHYASDAQDVMHKLKNEDYEGCHAPFENKVGNAVKKNPEVFSITQCCNAPKQCFSFTSSDLKQVIAFVKQETGLQNNLQNPFFSSVQPSKPQSTNGISLSGLLEKNKELLEKNKESILVFLAVLLFLYVVFTRKRR